MGRIGRERCGAVVGAIIGYLLLGRLKPSIMRDLSEVVLALSDTAPHSAL